MECCPFCRSTTVGRVGNRQYFCWSCCHEFAVGEHGIQRYAIVEDGSLTRV